jgi:hypothetical protein
VFSDADLPSGSCVYVPGKPGKQYEVSTAFDANAGDTLTQGGTGGTLTLVSKDGPASDHPFPSSLDDFSAFVVVSERIDSTGYSI